MQGLKMKLSNGEPVIGTMVTVIEESDIVNILKVCGFDYFIIDNEHGHIDYGKVANLFALAKALGIPGIVRIPEVKREVVLKYMEMGAAGILLPNTESVEEAKALVRYSKYYPLGNRGVSLSRPHTGYEKVINAEDYMQEANEETILMIQIESDCAVEIIDELLDVDGIDVAFIGPNDLTQSMGIIGQFNHPKFLSALEKVIEAARRKNKYSGIHFVTEPEKVQEWIGKGMMFNAWSNDVAMIMDSARQGVKKLKSVTVEL